MFMRWFIMGMLFEEKKDGEGGGGGGGASGAGAADDKGAAGANGGTQGAQGGADAGKGGKGADDKGKGAQGGAAGAGGAGTAKSPAKKAADLPDDDDDEDEGLKPGDDGLLQPMSLKAFTRRVGRASKKQLRDLFGTDDKEAIAAQWKELPALRDYKAAAEREKLTEREKLQAEAEEAKKKVSAAEDRATAAEHRADHREYTTKLKGHLLTLVDKDDVNDMMDKLARAVIKGDVKNFKQARAWCSEYVAGHPKWAKGDAETTKDAGADAGAGKGGKDERRRVPVSTAKRDGEKPKPGNGGGDKDIDWRTMSKAEVFKRTGLRV